MNKEDLASTWEKLAKITNLPLKTNGSHLKMDDWNTIVSFWDGQFSGANC